MSHLATLLKHIGVISNLNTEDAVLDFILNGVDSNNTVYADRDIAASNAAQRPGPFSRSLVDAMGLGSFKPGMLSEAEIEAALAEEAVELGLELEVIRSIKTREVKALTLGTFIFESNQNNRLCLILHCFIGWRLAFICMPRYGIVISYLFSSYERRAFPTPSISFLLDLRLCLFIANAETARQEALESAIAVFTALITECPDYASALNNRAQARQLLAMHLVKQQQSVEEAAANAAAGPATAAAAGDESAEPAAPAVAVFPSTPEGKAVVQKAQMLQVTALSDLNQAIMICHKLYNKLLARRRQEKASAKNADASAATSNGTATATANGDDVDDSGYRPPRALLQALCQRAALHRLRGNDEQALLDMHKAAELGSAWAQRERAAMHPVAQLNSEMMGEMLQMANAEIAKEKEGRAKDAQGKGE